MLLPNATASQERSHHHVNISKASLLLMPKQGASSLHEYDPTTSDISWQHACAVQVTMCRHLDDNILQSMVGCCQEGMRLGAKHKDLHMQAQASHALGGMEALYNPPE